MAHLRPPHHFMSDIYEGATPDTGFPVDRGFLGRVGAHREVG